MFLLSLECILPACRGATSINVLPQIVKEILCGLFLVGQLVQRLNACVPFLPPSLPTPALQVWGGKGEEMVDTAKGVWHSLRSVCD
jgi:hypothetical protein